MMDVQEVCVERRWGGDEWGGVSGSLSSKQMYLLLKNNEIILTAREYEVLLHTDKKDKVSPW